MLHAVIQADRAFYTVHVVERLQEMGVVVASENWKTQKNIPLPVQVLGGVSQTISQFASQD